VKRSAIILAALAALSLAGLARPAPAAEPVKLGLSVSLTGPLALYGKQALLTLQLWKDDINAKGGILGRPVDLVYYDDQGNPALVPGIYTKLLDVDHADLLMSIGTVISVPALPTAIEHNMVLMVSFALAVNEKFHYDRFFQSMPYGPDGKDSLTHGFFSVAETMNPKPATVALTGADNEFSKAALEGARANAKRAGLNIVYDRAYPPATIDYAPIVQSMKAARPDIVFMASYPGDTAGLLRSIGEIGLDAKMLGGAMVGTQAAAVKAQFGEELDRIVSYELYVHEPTMNFPGIDAFLETWRAHAAPAGLDALGYYFPPFIYASAQVLVDGVTAVGSLDQDKLAHYMHQATFDTIVGPIKFGADGEWAKPRILTIQYQHLSGHGIEQFTHAGTQVILDPPDLKTGALEYPYVASKR
jgi:branched-chain amino acid transport system substrate-binding protein